MQVIQKYIVSSKKILFEGDGYSEEWHKEAEKRGLPNLKTTPVALDAMVTEKSKKLFIYLLNNILVEMLEHSGLIYSILKN